MQLSVPKTIQPFLQRLFVFVCVFLVYSGAIGPRIIGSDILSRDGFNLYGGVGKALLFALIAFAFLAYRAENNVRLPAWRRHNIVWLALSLGSFAAAWLSVGHLLQGERTAFWLIGAHTFLLASILFALGGCFGPATLRLLARSYRRQLLVAALAGAGFYALLTGIYHMWPLLAGAVLHSVAWLLRLGGITVAIVPPRTLLFTKFGITIAQYCSGIESLALFSGLYGIVGFLDWPRFNKRRLLSVFPLALVLLFGCNILRVYLLILGGYFINPHIAFSLFHTYAGMVFFIIYSCVFWALSYRWLTTKRAQT